MPIKKRKKWQNFITNQHKGIKEYSGKTPLSNCPQCTLISFNMPFSVFSNCSLVFTYCDTWEKRHFDISM